MKAYTTLSYLKLNTKTEGKDMKRTVPTYIIQRIGKTLVREPVMIFVSDFHPTKIMTGSLTANS